MNFADVPIWVVNGLLVLLFAAVDNLAFLLQVGLSVYLYLQARPEYRQSTFATLAVALAAGLLAPNPVPLFLTLMSVSAIFVNLTDKYSPAASFWNSVQNLGIYSGAGLFYAIWQGVGYQLISSNADPAIAQGLVYLNAVFGIAMIVLPVGFMGWAAKSLWAHPPAIGTPRQIFDIRTRGRQDGR
jgi:hypothetical protein